MKPTLEQLKEYKNYLEKVEIRKDIINFLQTSTIEMLKEKVKDIDTTDIKSINFELDYNSDDEGGLYHYIDNIKIEFAGNKNVVLSARKYDDEDKAYDKIQRFLSDIDRYDIIEENCFLEYGIDFKEPFELTLK